MKTKKSNHLRSLNAVFVCMTLWIFTSCLDESESDFDRQLRHDYETIEAYLDLNDIDADFSNYGFYYKALKKNDDGQQTEKDDILCFNYKISMLNEAVIDSATSTSGNIGIIKNDQDKIVPGILRYAIAGMREGEKYQFFIPSVYAYGSYSYSKVISKQSNLVFEAELVEIRNSTIQKSIENDSIEQYLAAHNLEGFTNPVAGIFYKKLESGSGENPQKGQIVKVSYSATYLDGSEFDSTEANKPISIEIGKKEMPEGFEAGIKLMQKGEKAIVIMRSDLGYGASRAVIPRQVRADLIDKEYITEKILPYSVLVYEIELVDID
ncbi:MAG: FKBP-type peptidyl-prolyl cis-trans isomerase [Cytophagales bacterium]|nr:FKBP-type peptidyl-prolyl cis-trans isomerase [Cytophagales bacterium]